MQREHILRSEISTTVVVPHPRRVDKESLQLLCEHVKTHGFATYCFEESALTDSNSAQKDVMKLARLLNLKRHDRGVLVEHESLSVLQDKTGTPLGRFPPVQQSGA